MPREVNIEKELAQFQKDFSEAFEEFCRPWDEIFGEFLEINCVLLSGGLTKKTGLAFLGDSTPKEVIEALQGLDQEKVKLAMAKSPSKEVH